MSSFNARFKNKLGLAKRNSSASIQSQNLNLNQNTSTNRSNTPDLTLAHTQSRTPPPQLPPLGQAQPLVQGVGVGTQGPTSASQSSISIPHLQQSQSPPHGASQQSPNNSSQQSLPPMNHPGQGQRPPSYSAGYPGGSMPLFSFTVPLRLDRSKHPLLTGGYNSNPRSSFCPTLPPYLQTVNLADTNLLIFQDKHVLPPRRWSAAPHPSIPELQSQVIPHRFQARCRAVHQLPVALLATPAPGAMARLKATIYQPPTTHDPPLKWRVTAGVRPN